MPTNPKNFIRIAQGAHPCRVFVAKFPNIYSFGVPQPTAAPARFAQKAKWPFAIISYCQYSVVSKTFQLRPTVTSIYTRTGFDNL